MVVFFVLSIFLEYTSSQHPFYFLEHFTSLQPWSSSFQKKKKKKRLVRFLFQYLTIVFITYMNSMRTKSSRSHSLNNLWFLRPSSRRLCTLVSLAAHYRYGGAKYIVFPLVSGWMCRYFALLTCYIGKVVLPGASTLWRSRILDTSTKSNMYMREDKRKRKRQIDSRSDSNSYNQKLPHLSTIQMLPNFNCSFVSPSISQSPRRQQILYVTPRLKAKKKQKNNQPSN